MKPYSKYFEKIRVRRDQGRGAEVARAGLPVGRLQGSRAPIARRSGGMKEGEYFHFCFDHVREYNKGFNYFSGLADTEIARFQKEAMTGHRPTWTMGANGGAALVARRRAEALAAAPATTTACAIRSTCSADRRTSARRERKAKPLEAKALETLGLDAKATGKDIKSRYKELVKRHHPDANGGDRGSEDRFRDVLQAYRVLKQAGLC